MNGQIAEDNSRLPRLLFLIVLSIVAGPPKYGASQTNLPDRYTIRVNVGMVVLHASVRQRNGTPWPKLSKEDFQVYEDGVGQRIESFSAEDIPVTAGLVVDSSGSMGPKRREAVIAALTFARLSNPRDQMFVVHFNENVWFGLPDDTPFTDRQADLRAALLRSAANGKTALYDAVAAALEHLLKSRQDKKVLIVISDGADNASKHNLAQIMSMAKQSEAIIYTIGLFEPADPDRNPGVLRQLAKATGGEAFLPDSLQDIEPVCERIARDIRNQYTLGYLPANQKQDGAYRAIEVKAAAPHRGRLSVRTRTGYYSPSRPQPPSPGAGHDPPGH
jgi:Ca-activated chloride channel family protein